MTYRRLLVFTPLFAACASAATPLAGTTGLTSATSAPAADHVVWVRMAGQAANASVVLTGDHVQLVAGARGQRGDTLYARVPFAIALPDSAFEVQIATRGSARAQAPIAEVEYTTKDATGEPLDVTGRGAQIILRRGAPGEEVTLGGQATAMYRLRARASE